jgi:hypothetical protein
VASGFSRPSTWLRTALSVAEGPEGCVRRLKPEATHEVS